MLQCPATYYKMLSTLILGSLGEHRPTISEHYMNNKRTNCLIITHLVSRSCVIKRESNLTTIIIYLRPIIALCTLSTPKCRSKHLSVWNGINVVLHEILVGSRMCMYLFNVLFNENECNNYSRVLLNSVSLGGMVWELQYLTARVIIAVRF